MPVLLRIVMLRGPRRSSCKEYNLQRPRIERLGVFCLHKEKMKIDNKEIKQTEWYKMYVLTPTQVKKLVEEKLERARAYHEAEKKREALIESR